MRARDFFYNRVMFPISDARGRMVAFGARALDPDAKPKYINTGETSLFSKGHLLYNFATARAAALKAQTIILAEGYMDVIALVRAGFEHAVAPLGTAFTEDQLQLLWRTAPEPILSFDGDEAGLRAGIRAAHLALPHLKPGFSLRFAFLPEGEDPDTLIKREGLAAMKKILDEAQPLSKVLWRAETEDKDFSTPERRAGLERALSRNRPAASPTPRSPITIAAISTSRYSTPSSAAPRRAKRDDRYQDRFADRRPQQNNRRAASMPARPATGRWRRCRPP